MGFHYPFFTFGDWLWSVLCFLVVVLIVIWLFSGLGRRCRREMEICGDCGETDCDCDAAAVVRKSRNESRKRPKAGKEI